MRVAATNKGIRPENAPQKAAYRSSLSMYSDPPNETITLEDFEVLAFERLKLLKAIENAKSRSLSADQYDTVVKEALKMTLGKPSDPTFYRNDQVSHHILRLAYCSTDEQRKWFLNHECLLFRYRAERETPQGLLEFMSRYNLNFELASDEEKAFHRDNLRIASEAKPVRIEQVPTGGSSDSSAAGGGDGGGGGGAAPSTVEVYYKPSDPLYKVRFTEVGGELLKGLEVFLHKGYAFVPGAKMITSIVAKFRAYNSFSLVQANKFLPLALRDERLKPMLENMSQTYVGNDYSSGSRGANGRAVEAVTANDVDELATTIFPLCMSQMHASLKERHKLKHLGRLQYGLFLKGVGLPLEEALAFWQKEFTKGCSADEFLKKYAYNIRYNYGKEGKRTDFAPYSCVKIITSPPQASDETHGCPFKTLDMTSLKNHLMKMKLSSQAIDSIAESVRAKEYQIACRKQFEARFHGADSNNVGNHPNAYAEAANNFLKTVNGTAGGGGAGAAPAEAGAGAAGAGAGGAASSSSSSSSDAAAVAAR